MIASILRLAQGPPVTPDAPEACEWLRDELAKQAYLRAKPTPFDDAAAAVRRFFESLTVPQISGAGWVLIVIAAVVVAAVVVIAFIVYGAPRRRRRRAAPSAVFGDDDPRTAAEFRLVAAGARASGEWDLAVVAGFRALARALAQRTIISVVPGTTAREVAVRIGDAFTEQRYAAGDAASAFDRVRYLGRHASKADADAVAALDAVLEHARPAGRDPGAAGDMTGDLIGAARGTARPKETATAAAGPERTGPGR